jgi:hypothetical protein
LCIQCARNTAVPTLRIRSNIFGVGGSITRLISGKFSSAPAATRRVIQHRDENLG